MINAYFYFAFTVLLGLAGHGLFWAWLQRTFPQVQRHRRLALTLVVLLSLGAGTFRVLARRTDWAWAAFASMGFALESLAVFASALLSLLITALILAALRVVAWLRRDKTPQIEQNSLQNQPDSLPQSSTETTQESAEVHSTTLARSATPEPPQELSRRQLIERGVGLSLYATAGSMLGWGMVYGRHDYQIEEFVVRVPGLSRKLDGYTIAQVSDLHAGPFVRENDFDYGFSYLKSFRPDLVVATGDLIDHDPSYAPMLARKLAELGARDGTVAILGNHDYYAGSARVERAMRDAGVQLLVNQGLHLRRGDGGGFAIIGLDDYAGLRSGRGPHLTRTLNTLPPAARELPRIALAHQPPFFDQLWGNAFLQLSGHTHGGQINPAGINVAKLVGMKYVQGAYKKLDGSQLWVNRGFGVAGPPSRINAPPEITKIVLVAA